MIPVPDQQVPLRVDPYPDESLPGYLLRVSAQHGLPVGHLLRAAGVTMAEMDRAVDREIDARGSRGWDQLAEAPPRSSARASVGQPLPVRLLGSRARPDAAEATQRGKPAGVSCHIVVLTARGEVHHVRGPALDDTCALHGRQRACALVVVDRTTVT